MMKKYKYVAFFMLLMSMMLFETCSVNPVSGKKELSLMSESQEKNLGKSSDPSIVAQFGLYENKKMQSFINTKGLQMAKISHRPNLGYEFKILDSPVINAFAVPGGYVYFTRGIMAHFNNEAEFAGVLGHEIGHITARHSARQYRDQMLAQVGLLVGMVVSPTFRQFGQEAGTAMQLMFLKFSRNHETQSDKLGVEYSTKVGYDAHEMANFFGTLSRMRQGTEAEGLPTFMSTHPDPGDRFNKVHALADKWQADLKKTNLRVNRGSYLNMIDGLIYGDDPRQGYVQNNVFYHPELKFSYPTPSGWQINNMPTQVQMAPKDGKAYMIFTLSSEKTPQAAAQKAATDFKLNVQSTNNVNIGGFQAVEMISSQTNQDQSTGQNVTIRVKSAFIKYGQFIYVFHGVTDAQTFNNYVNTFDRTMKGFKKLTDSSKINVKPERLKIVTVKQNGTLQQALSAYNQPSAKMKELSLLNGMELNDQVKSGQKIKTVVK